MRKIDYILSRYRMIQFETDYLVDGLRTNRLFGLKELILNNLNTNSRVCEIGSHAGVSSSLFAYYCRRVYCIDYFPELVYEQMFDEVAKEFKNIVKIKDKSENVCHTFPDHYFDLVYIDAMHDYSDVKNDILNWTKKVKIRGFIGGHDYNSLNADGVIKAVDEMFGEPDKVYEDSSWIKRL